MDNMLENGVYWLIVNDGSWGKNSSPCLVVMANCLLTLALLLIRMSELLWIGTLFLCHVILKGWSPWLLEHIICVRIPSVISSSNAKGDIRGGTKQINIKKKKCGFKLFYLIWLFSLTLLADLKDTSVSVCTTYTSDSESFAYKSNYSTYIAESRI